MGRRITVGQFPITATQLFIANRSISAPDSAGDLSFDENGINLGDPAGDVAVITVLKIEDSNELRFVDGSGNYTGFKPPSDLDGSNVVYSLPSTDGDRAGQVLTTDSSSSLTWTNVKYTYSIETASFNAETWKAYFIDTSSASIIATLPATPVIGDTIRFFDLASTFDSQPLVLARNGGVIMGDSSADLTVNTINAAFDIVYSNATHGWRIITV